MARHGRIGGLAWPLSDHAPALEPRGGTVVSCISRALARRRGRRARRAPRGMRPCGAPEAVGAVGRVQGGARGGALARRRFAVPMHLRGEEPGHRGPQALGGLPVALLLGWAFAVPKRLGHERGDVRRAV